MWSDLFFSAEACHPNTVKITIMTQCSKFDRKCALRSAAVKGFLLSHHGMWNA